MPERHGYKIDGGWASGNDMVNGNTVPQQLTVNSRTNSTPPEYRASRQIELTEGFESGSVSDAFVAYIADGTNTPASGIDGTGGEYNVYRYGFNGKENDNEVKGEGDEQDYGMRIYDTRLGKFLSVDPISKSYPWNSPYSFAENDPINFIDLDGLEKAKKQTFTYPVYVKFTTEQVYGLVLKNAAQIQFKANITTGTWSLGAKEFSYIATYEALTLTMYDADGAASGNASIGFGKLIHTGKIGNTDGNTKLEEPYKNGITIDQATDFLVSEMHVFEGYVNKYLMEEGIKDNITGRQYSALVDIAYNMGQSKAKQIVKIIKEKGAPEAARVLRTWVKGGKGLRDRREFEARLLENKDLKTHDEVEAERVNQEEEERRKKKAEKKSLLKKSKIK